MFLARVTLVSDIHHPFAFCFTTNFAPISAGGDTTVSALGTFFLAMTMYPKVHKKAQAAVDEVVGRGRLPDFQDDIPYLDAVVREVLRWRAVLPLSIPHAVTEDDIYKGYHIPAGAVVVENTWGLIQRRVSLRAEHGRIIPERWLTKAESIKTVLRDPSATFGFGRAYTQDMAQWSIWICAASILATLDISQSLNEKGVQIEPSGEYLRGMLWCVLSRGPYRALVYLPEQLPIPHQCVS
ncbi:cytochrome P450 [Mycena capillaripes]|nr:cytochrome P450 [Mycena capillaripes]